MYSKTLFHVLAEQAIARAPGVGQEVRGQGQGRTHGSRATLRASNKAVAAPAYRRQSQMRSTCWRTPAL